MKPVNVLISTPKPFVIADQLVLAEVAFQRFELCAFSIKSEPRANQCPST